MNFVIIDVETTGGSVNNSKITELAIYKFDGEKIIDEFVTLVNPEIPIPEFIVRLTGISDHMVTKAPKFYEIAKQVIEFCTVKKHRIKSLFKKKRNKSWLLFQPSNFRPPH